MNSTAAAVRVVGIVAVFAAAALRIDTMSMLIVAGSISAIAVGKIWQGLRNKNTKEK